MQLNLVQFLAALQQADGSVSATAGVVTFANGDTFDVAANAAGQEPAADTPLAAAGVLADIHADEPAIVDAFRAGTQGERNRLGQALASFYQVLCMESKFQPILLEESIKIPVTSFEEGLVVQRSLFRMGCGFHHGRYPLSKDLSNQCTLSGIFVSRKGVMTVMPYKEPGSVAYVANHESRAVSPATVLAAVSLADLLRTAL
jgi:hypothetical protein